MKCFAFNDRYALLLVPGNTQYICRMGTTHIYSATQLLIFDEVKQWRADAFGKIDERGRFNLKRVQSHRVKIDAAFHEGVADLLEWDATLDLSTRTPWFKIIDPEQWAANEAQKARSREWRKQNEAARRKALLDRFKMSSSST